MNKLKKLLVSLSITAILAVIFIPSCLASGEFNLDVNGSSIDTLEVVIMLTLIALVPSILIMTTCFTRVIITLSFLRNAIGVQQTPPNQVLIGIALFLTLFIMTPVMTEINTTAYEPYKNEVITQDEFLERAAIPLKKFMVIQCKSEDIDLFINISNTEVKTVDDNGQALERNEILLNLPLTTVIPAFVTSELKRAFTIGFFIFIPFLVIDMIVSSVLMSMGMIMLPPVMISLPFKLLLFVLVDGWGLMFKMLVQGFEF